MREGLILAVRPRPGHRTQGILELAGRTLPCALGRSGVAALKREGDGATPIGSWPLREVFYRPDRGPRPTTGVAVRALRPDDGWCDTPFDANYNRNVRLPYDGRTESMWRDDHLYDIVVMLGYNDCPRVQGAGSAIFMHLAREGYRPTQGCVALARRDLEFVLRLCGPGSVVAVAGI